MDRTKIERHMREKETRLLIASLNSIQTLVKETGSELINVSDYMLKMKYELSNPTEAMNKLSDLGCVLEPNGGMDVSNVFRTQKDILDAINPDTDPKILNELSHNSSVVVLRGVSTNHSTSPEALQRLSKSEHPLVRQGVALNRRTPQETLQALSDDGNKSVRWLLSCNPRTPEAILIRLCADGRATVEVLAKRSSSTLVLNHIIQLPGYENAKLLILGRDDIPVEFIEQLIKDNQRSVSFFARQKRIDIAVEESPSVPREWVESLY